MKSHEETAQEWHDREGVDPESIPSLAALLRETAEAARREGREAVADACHQVIEEALELEQAQGAGEVLRRIRARGEDG